MGVVSMSAPDSVVFGDLRQCALAFRKICLDGPTGAVRAVSNSINNPRRTLIELRKYDAWLREVTKEHAAKGSLDQEEAGRPPKESPTQDAAGLEGGAPSEAAQVREAEIRLTELQQEAQQLAAKNSREHSVVQRLLLSRTLQSTVFPSVGDPPTEEDAQMKQALQYRDSKVHQMLELDEQQGRLKQQLQNSRRESATMMEHNRELNAEIQNQLGRPIQEAEKTDAVRRLEAKRKDLAEKNAVLRRVFMALIIESGANWAKESALLEIMMTLEQGHSLSVDSIQQERS